MKSLARILLPLLVVSCTSTPTPEEIREVTGIAIDRYDGGTPTLVFLHGWACDRSHWRKQLPVFTGTHEVVTMDLAGHGDSVALKNRWTALSLADEVVDVVHRLNRDEVILIGHSMGGTVALAAAARLPDCVIGVIGVDCLHNAEFAFPPDQIDQSVQGFRQDFDKAMVGFSTQMFAGLSNADELSQTVIASTRRIRPEVAIALFESFPATDYPDLFREARVPIRCINASEPWKTEVEINRKYADYNVQIMEGVTHFPMLEAPEAFNEHLAAAIVEILRASSDGP